MLNPGARFNRHCRRTRLDRNAAPAALAVAAQAPRHPVRSAHGHDRCEMRACVWGGDVQGIVCGKRGGKERLGLPTAVRLILSRSCH